METNTMMRIDRIQVQTRVGSPALPSGVSWNPCWFYPLPWLFL
jgi:hypothetical protein